MSYRKGLTYEELYGAEKAEQIRAKISQNHRDVNGKENPMYGRTHSLQTKRKIATKAIGNTCAILKNNEQHVRRSNAVKETYITNPKLRVVRSNHFRKINGGSNHWRWKGGMHRYVTYGKYRVWQFVRSFVRERDNYHCQSCGISESELGKELSVHHIRSIVDYPHLRYVPSNLISYCASCHIKEELKNG